MPKSRRAVSRRTFLATSAVAASRLITAPAVASAQPSLARSTRANERVNVGVVGIAGRGAEDLHSLENTAANIVALCDCDQRRAADSSQRYPKARLYTDWRKMLEQQKDLDAVLVATPDHNHAIISVHAMRLGKHVYCEKPLAHSIWEARLMAQTAQENNVATQMGTQGHAFEGTRQAVEVVRAGAIGEVSELHVWTNRPHGWWPQGIVRPADTAPVPAGLDWDVWLGPAPKRPYNPAYVPFKWRGFWDFGTGAIGDMGIHNLDTAYWALELTVPTSVEVKACSPPMGSGPMRETAPLWSIIKLHFPARGDKPAVKMTWYDGGKLPPADLFDGEPVPSGDGGSLLIGSKGKLLTRTWNGGETPKDWFVLLPRKQFAGYSPPTPTLPRVASHHAEWIDACRGGPLPLSNFGYASSLTESLLLGNVALRVGKKIDWDANQMRDIDCPQVDAFLHPEFREGWNV